jgi:toxin ParE1/3/4
MAQVIWTEPALSDLAEIAEYIALDNPDAAERVVQNVFAHTDQLIDHPRSGSYLPEQVDKRYRQIIEPPCRVIYSIDGERVQILYVLRFEQLLRKDRLSDFE